MTQCIDKDCVQQCCNAYLKCIQPGSSDQRASICLYYYQQAQPQLQSHLVLIIPLICGIFLFFFIIFCIRHYKVKKYKKQHGVGYNPKKDKKHTSQSSDSQNNQEDNHHVQPMFRQNERANPFQHRPQNQRVIVQSNQINRFRRNPRRDNNPNIQQNHPPNQHNPPPYQPRPPNYHPPNYQQHHQNVPNSSSNLMQRPANRNNDDQPQNPYVI